MSTPSIGKPGPANQAVPPRSGNREQVWMTIKLLIMFGVCFGGIWVVDQIVSR